MVWGNQIKNINEMSFEEIQEMTNNVFKDLLDHVEKIQQSNKKQMQILQEIKNLR